MSDPELDRVQILIDLGRLPAARELLGRILARDPANAPALCLLALCHDAAGEPAAMLSAAERASAAEPDNEWAHRLRALALRQLERTDEATEAARVAIRLVPEGWHGYAALALVRAATPAGRRESFAASREAVRLAPDEAGAHFVRGFVLHGFGRLAAAQRSYRETLRIDPQHAAALENLGRLAESGSRLRTSIDLYRAAAVAAPTDVAGLSHVRGVLLQLLGLAWGTTAALMFVLLFGLFPLAWAIAAVLVLGYLAWAARIVRLLPLQLRAAGRVWLRTDPRFVVRVWATGVNLLTALTVGVISLVAGDPGGGAAAGRLVFLLLGILVTVLLLGAVATLLADRRARRRGVGDVTDDAAPGTDGRTMFTAFRLFRSSCVAAALLFLPAIERGSTWGLRMILGFVVAMGCYWHIRRIRRQQAPAVGALWRYNATWFAMIMLGWFANLIFIAAVVVLPDSQRDLLGNLAVAPFVLVPLAAVIQCGWLVVRIRAQARERRRATQV